MTLDAQPKADDATEVRATEATRIPRALRLRDKYEHFEDVLPGKRIAAAIGDVSRVGLRFTDGTWIYFEATGDEDMPTIECDARIDDDDMEALGVIDHAEFQARNDARNAQELARKREEFERLRKELGK